MPIEKFALNVHRDSPRVCAPALPVPSHTRGVVPRQFCSGCPPGGAVAYRALPSGGRPAAPHAPSPPAPR